MPDQPADVRTCPKPRDVHVCPYCKGDTAYAIVERHKCYFCLGSGLVRITPYTTEKQDEQ